MKKLFYTRELNLDETNTYNGIRFLTVYSLGEDSLKLEFELECLADEFLMDLMSDEEEIQFYLDNNGMGDKVFEIIRL